MPTTFHHLPIIESLAHHAIDLASKAQVIGRSETQRQVALPEVMPLIKQRLEGASLQDNAVLQDLASADCRVVDGQGFSRPAYRLALRAYLTGHPYETRGVEPATQPAPLHTQAHDEAYDEWTYRELVALHGLHLAALLDAGQLERVHLACLHHVQHTQPDYTTYEPWALAAFVHFDDTHSFADQQLHDVQTHLAIEGPQGAAVVALLLADAATQMRSLT